MFNLEASWKKQLESELNKEYIKEIFKYIKSQRSEGKEIYPKDEDIFNAFNQAPFKNLKAVIIGQDPYHGPDQAHGLSFSVLPGVKVPPSLKNIYKELKNDLNITAPEHGNLVSWAKEGVLLLNNTLTVEKSNPGSHRKIGWEQFTDKVIEILNDKKENLVFILWGNDARKKAQNVDRTKHLVLESAHPSPFSATKFYNNHHFSKTNEYLKMHSIKPIDWQLP